jgi:hypothetical protein
MSLFDCKGRVFASTILAAVIWAAPTWPATAQQNVAPPDFSANQVGWVGVGGGFGAGGEVFAAVPGQLPPLRNDPAHPFVPNGTKAQPNYRIADLSNPNLKPWVKEQMKKDNDEVLAGKIAFTARSSCMPAGVPAFMAYGGPTPLYFVQTPREVWMIFSGDHQVRRVYLDVRHSENPKASWYGESVGHYAGDTLVIDTIGQNDKTVVDPYRTPHTERMHVVERWKMVDGGKALEVSFTVSDPDAFDAPWSGKRRYRQVKEAMTEDVCAENNLQFNYHIPVAAGPDF